MATYNVKTRSVEAKPRSKRLRELGVYVSGGGSSAGSSASDSGSVSDGHTHANKAALDAISIDTDNYLYLSQKPEGGDTTETVKVKAGYSDDSDKFDGKEFADYFDQPLRKTDIVEFAKVVAVIFKTPGFAAGIETGSGAQIDEGGNAEMNSLILRSFLKVPQLIYNKVRVTGGEMWNTEGGVIKTVTADGDNAYLLTLEVEDGDHVELDVDDICKGHYNTSGGFVTSYFRVTYVDDAAATVRIVLGADAAVPGGINCAPVAFMNVARYGNFTQTERQRSQYFSSSSQQIVMLSGVDSYIITSANRVLLLGSVAGVDLPENLPVSASEASGYMKNIIAENFIQLDASGAIIKTIRDRGLWDETPDTPYLCTATEQDEVHCDSCKYRCIVNGTTERPAYNSTSWLLIAGDTALYMRIDSTGGHTFLWNQLQTTLVATVKRGLVDITSNIADGDWAWTRDTGDAVSDAVWNSSHASSTSSINLVNEDLNGSTGKFVCTAYVRDGVEIETLTEEYWF
jgi:hypothetical protein